jgi:hypothetical protein
LHGSVGFRLIADQTGRRAHFENRAFLATYSDSDGANSHDVLFMAGALSVGLIYRARQNRTPLRQIWRNRYKPSAKN